MQFFDREALEPVGAVAIRRRPLRSPALPEALSCDFGQIRPKLVATGSITIESVAAGHIEG
jgi:hypothetical protein